MQHAHPLNKLISWKFSEPNTRLFDDRFHFAESAGSTLFPSFLHELRLYLAIESYFLFIIELWPPEYHGAIHARKVLSLPPRKFSFFLSFFSQVVNIQPSMWNTQNMLLHLAVFLPRPGYFAAVGFCMYMWSIDTNSWASIRILIKFSPHSWGGGGKLGECLFTRMGKVSDGLRLFLSLYPGLCYAILSSITVHVKLHKSLHFFHGVTFTRLPQ